MQILGQSLHLTQDNVYGIMENLLLRYSSAYTHADLGHGRLRNVYGARSRTTAHGQGGTLFAQHPLSHSAVTMSFERKASIPQVFVPFG